MTEARDTIQSALNSVDAELKEIDIKYHTLKAKSDAYKLALMAIDEAEPAPKARAPRKKSDKPASQRVSKPMLACLLYIHEFNGNPNEQDMTSSGHDVKKYLKFNDEPIISFTTVGYQVTDAGRDILIKQGQIKVESEGTTAQDDGIEHWPGTQPAAAQVAPVGGMPVGNQMT